MRVLRVTVLTVVLLTGTVGAVAQVAPDRVSSSPGILDTYSHFMFSFNGSVYRFLDGMRGAPTGPPPETGGGGLGHVAINLINEPMTLLSATLMGDWPAAGLALRRFGINSTVGLLGWNDVATVWGHPRQELDLGLVLCSYGVNSGPYVVIPFIGPRTARDAFTDVIVTNAILWTTMWMLLDPAAGLWAIAAAEAVEVVADIAATRQIDSRARRLKFEDYETMRAEYLRQRLDRCNQVRGVAAAPERAPAASALADAARPGP